MSRKTRTKSKTRNNAKSRAKKATVSTVKSTDTEETVRNASRRKSGY